MGGDQVDAGAGNDTVIGGPDADSLSGGNGADRIETGAKAVLVDGGGGLDHWIADLSASAANIVLIWTWRLVMSGTASIGRRMSSPTPNPASTMAAAFSPSSSVGTAGTQASLLRYALPIVVSLIAGWMLVTAHPKKPSSHWRDRDELAPLPA